jgi:hypothetical protein
MSSYLLDIMCTTQKYPRMGWLWKPSNPTIHVSCKVLWENKYHIKYRRICKHFLAPLYKFIFHTTPPRMTDKSIVVIRIIEDWYLMDKNTYIRVYVPMKPPHLLPRFLPDKRVL